MTKKGRARRDQSVLGLVVLDNHRAENFEAAAEGSRRQSSGQGGGTRQASTNRVVRTITHDEHPKARI